MGIVDTCKLTEKANKGEIAIVDVANVESKVVRERVPDYSKNICGFLPTDLPTSTVFFRGVVWLRVQVS